MIRIFILRTTLLRKPKKYNKIHYAFGINELTNKMFKFFLLFVYLLVFCDLFDCVQLKVIIPIYSKMTFPSITMKFSIL